jgi:hypothetical protein
MNNNQVTWNEWWKRNALRVLRHLVAGAIICFVASPLAGGLKQRANLEIVSVIPLTMTTVQTTTTASTAQVAGDATRTAPIASKNEPHSQKKITKKNESAVPRVWTYGLQIGALVAALSAALWTIVALCRTDS